MHLGIPALLDFYRKHNDEESLVLATIVATEGSTYRKPGAMMLVNRAGQFEGMISGGCLEGDLLHHAEEVFDDGVSKFVTYDMHELSAPATLMVFTSLDTLLFAFRSGKKLFSLTGT